MAWNSKCSDPRDKIFALLGMLRSNNSNLADAIDVNYEMGVSELYKRVVELLIDREGKLEILKLCDLRPASIWRPSWAPNFAEPKVTLQPIVPQYAALYTADSSRTLGHVLEAKGVLAATVCMAEPIRLTNLSAGSEAAGELKRLFKLVGSGFPGRSQDLYQSMLYLMTLGRMSDHSYNPSTGWLLCNLSRRALKNALHVVIESGHDDHSGNEEAPDHTQAGSLALLDSVFRYWIGRSIARTSEGHFLLAPAYTQVGDVLAVMLGLSVVMVLHPSDCSKYEVVGPAYAHGLNWGEALLGPLPRGWTYMRAFDKNLVATHAFRDVITDAVTRSDPRIHWDKLKVPFDYEGPRITHRGQDGKLVKSWKLPDESYFQEEHGLKLQTLHLI